MNSANRKSAYRRRRRIAEIRHRIDRLVSGGLDGSPDPDILDKLLCELKKLPPPKTMPLSLGLNNFHGRLPGGYQRRFDADILHARHDEPGYGRRRRRMTLAEFHADIDRTIDELGLEPKEILRLQAGNDRRALNRYIMPLYVRLRQKGYKRYPDLVA